MKSKTTAIILAILFGGVGVHHFYLGNRGRGVIYLLLSWTLMPLIAAVVDALILATLTTEQFHSFYNLAIIPAEELPENVRNIRSKQTHIDQEFDQAA